MTGYGELGANYAGRVVVDQCKICFHDIFQDEDLTVDRQISKEIAVYNIL